jgi:septal ring factor EnvC (AmiA/AmiB activator)
MGIFWDLIQQSQIEEQKDKSDTLENRIKFLENELEKTQRTLIKTLHALEKHIGSDVDGDGKIGN